MTSVLIADDNPLIRRLIRVYLAAWPELNLYEAGDGVDAVQKAEQLHPDVIILDLAMPRMNGLEAARLLHQMMAAVPIFLFTVHADAVPPSELSRYGITASVSKDDIISLLSRIHEFVH
jgi:CheY-like chemotaxis protein